MNNEITTKRAMLEKMPFTAEEKSRWAEMMHRTWYTIAADACDGSFRLTRGIIVELVLDANRCEQYGGMTKEEAEFMSAIYHQPRFQRWARKQMNYV